MTKPPSAIALKRAKWRVQRLAVARVLRRTTAAAAAQAAAREDRVRKSPGNRPDFTKYGSDDAVPKRRAIVT